MVKAIELVGTLAPLAVLVFLFVQRRRAPVPARLGMVGAAFAGAGSLAELIGSRAVWFGGGGAEDVFERLEGWGLLRLALVMAGLVVLVVAALVGPGRTMPRVPLAISGAIVALSGCALRFMHLDLDDADETVRILTTMAVETVQFGLLGLGILLVGIAVISGRDERPEPLDQAMKIGRSIAQNVQDNRNPGPAPELPISRHDRRDGKGNLERPRRQRSRK